MKAKGHLYLTINGGPVISLPVRINTDRLIMEFWYGDIDASTPDPDMRARIEGILTAMSDYQSDRGRARDAAPADGRE
jgi:hypothetical protein